MARRLDYYFHETATGLRRNALVAFAAITTVFISLFLLGGAQLIGRQINLIIDQQTERVEVSVYLVDNISKSDFTRLNQMLHSMPQVESIRYETKQEAYQRFKELFKNQPDLVNNVSPNALPASFRVKLKNSEQFGVIKAQLEGQPGIDTIKDQSEILNRLFAVSRALRYGAYGVSAIMILSAIGLIANTVRMGIFARRKEIGIMRLVGATNWFIRVPFLIEALFEGVLGALLAIGGLYILKNIFFNQFLPAISFLPVVTTQDLLALVPVILLGGVVVALVASWLAMRRFLEV